MGVGPGYGETPLVPEEADALTPQAREIFGDEPKKIDLYEAEQAISDDVSIALLDDIADGRLVLTDILTDAFLRDLHQKLYGDLWTWAGRYRTRDLNIGVEPERIAVELPRIARQYPVPLGAHRRLDSTRTRHRRTCRVRYRYKCIIRMRTIPWLPSD